MIRRWTTAWRLPRAARSSLSAAALVVELLGAAAPSRGDDIITRSGLVYSGVSVPVPGLNERTSKRNRTTPNAPELYWMLDDGVRRYFFPSRRVEREPVDELAGVVTFELPHRPQSRSTGPERVGSMQTTPFDEFGRRTATLQTARGPEPIVQAITRLRPDYVLVEGLTHFWTIGLDTRQLSDDLLSGLLHRAADQESLDDRKAIVLFLLRAERFAAAGQELAELQQSFPDQADWAAEQQQLIAEQSARRGMREVRRRRLAGQHALAYEIARKALPEQISADVLREAQELVDDYAQALERRDEAVVLLELFESRLPAEEGARVRPLRGELLEELNYSTLGRLEPFFRAAEDDGLSAAQKLALAYSGWVRGAPYADLDLEAALRAWQARFLVLEYLRTDDNALRREQLLQQLGELEGATVERIAQLVPQLPYVLEEAPPAPGEPREYSLTLPDRSPARYAVVLPAEHHPGHAYPLLVALRRSGHSLNETLRWWAGDAAAPGAAQRRGYVVVAPEFADPQADDYDYSIPAHQQVLAAIHDVRRRFSIDSNRIFLAGHELGADAAFDLGLAHPDVFAGVAPLVGRADRYCTFGWKNGLRTPWYIVAGERDRETLNQNATFVNNLVRRGADVVYCEYKARGLESYLEEQQRLFDWMDVQQRTPLADLKEGWETSIQRPSDNHFYWVTARDLPDRLYQPILWEQPRTIVRSLPFSSHITPGNTLYVKHPGGEADVWLSPEMIDFSSKLEVNCNGRGGRREFVTPSLAVLLEDLRVRGDRQRLFWAKVSL
jgi:predicted esterase